VQNLYAEKMVHSGPSPNPSPSGTQILAFLKEWWAPLAAVVALTGAVCFYLQTKADKSDVKELSADVKKLDERLRPIDRMQHDIDFMMARLFEGKKK
jgi:hypothetical protein